MTAATAQPVASATQKGTAFLQIVEFSGGVRVERTQTGKTALPRYWPEWLWWNLLNHDDTRYTVAVDIHESNSVVVEPNAPFEGLTQAVVARASKIRPVHSLESAIFQRDSQGGIVEWEVYADRVDDIRDCLRGLSLPGDARVFLRDRWLLTLTRDRHNPFPIRNLARMVEHQVAKFLWNI